MRIAHVTHTFSSLSETFIYDLLSTQRDLGLGCHVFTFERENERSRPFPNSYMHQIKRSRWNVLRYGNYLKASITDQNRETANWDLYRKQIKKKIRDINPDVIHAHFATMGVLMLPVSKELDIPLVVSFHGSDAFELTQRTFWRKKIDNLFRDASAITVVSKYMKEHLVELNCPPEKISLIHVGKKMDEYPFKHNHGELQKWISVGRLSEKKGFFDCVNAFKKISGKYPGTTLQIIGDGPLKNDLENEIQKLQIEQTVALAGAVPHAQVIQKLADADAFILCSKTSGDGDKEGIPTVLMEAQAVGLPCVSTQHSGIPEVIPAENKQFLAPEGNVKAIAKCMETLHACSVDERREIAKSGRLKVEKEFNVRTETKKLIKLYEHL